MENILYKSENEISTVTFNRPNHYNALDLNTLKTLKDILHKVQDNQDKVLVLTGNGKAFSAGGDVKMMTEIDKSQFEALMLTIADISETLYMMDKITIAAVNGSVAGLGLSLALACDQVIAHDQAKVGMLFAGIGLIPDGGGHFYLKERLGIQKAKQFIWQLKQVKAEEAKDMGLVDDVTQEDVISLAQLEAMKVLGSPFKALMCTKSIYHQEKLPDLKHILEAEKQGQLMAAETEDHQEGIQAFIEKRKPKFTGT